MKALYTSCLVGLSLLSACTEDEVPATLLVQDVTFTTPEDTPIVVQVPATSNRQISIQVTQQPQHGAIADMGNGVFQYTPEANYHGPDQVTVSFTAGDKTETATGMITVTPVNDAPVAG